MSRRRHALRAFAAAAILSLAAVALVVISPPPAEAAPSVRPLKVIALGDSYTAGNGGRNDRDDRDYYGPKGCYRSRANWSEKYVTSLNNSGYAATLINYACSDGVIDDIDLRARVVDSGTAVLPLTPVATNDVYVARLQSTGQCRSGGSDKPDEYYQVTVLRADPSPVVANQVSVTFKCERKLRTQVDGVGRDTDLVLMTAGGNDINFEQIVYQCFVVGTRDPGDCRRRVQEAEALLNQTNATGVRAKTERVLNSIRNKIGTDSKIVLVAYPYLEQLESYRLRSLLRSDTYDAGKEVRRIGLLGDTKQREAVDAVNAAAGKKVVTYLDGKGGVKEKFAGHEPHADFNNRNPERWLFEPGDTRVIKESYHPNGKGHEAIKDLLVAGGVFGAGSSSSANQGSVDIVFAIDTTGSMGSYLQAARDVSNQLTDNIAAKTNSYRVAVVSYRDHPEHTGSTADYPSRVDLDFTDNRDAFRTALSGLAASGGGDIPESLYSGLNTALDLKWRPGVKKVVIAIGDAPALDPEPVSNLTATDIVTKAFNVDPAEIYGVDVGGGSLQLADIAARSGGKVFTGATPADLSASLTAAINTALNKPFAWAGGPYTTKNGVPVTLDASGSFDVDGSITSYEWDFTGDGVYDLTTTQRTADHTYTADFDGLVAVRITDNDGQSSVGNAAMHSSVDGDQIPAATDNCPTIENHGQEDEDADGVGDACDSTPGFPTKDKDGIVVVSGPDVPQCLGKPITITGTAGRDVVRGTPGDDVIDTGAGVDVIQGNGGNDTICAGDGDDVVDVGAGNSRIDLGNGNDTARTGGGTDTVVGGAGIDRIATGAGADKVESGADNDVVDGGAGADDLDTGTGRDTLSGGADKDKCTATVASVVGQCETVVRR